MQQSCSEPAAGKGSLQDLQKEHLGTRPSQFYVLGIFGITSSLPAAQAQGSRKLLQQPSPLDIPGRIFAVALDNVAKNFGKVLAATTADSAVTSIAPAPAPAAAAVSIAAAPAPYPLIEGRAPACHHA